MIGTFLALAAAASVEVGGVAALPLPADALSAEYRGEPTLVVAGHAVVGIGADAQPGPRALTVISPSGSKHDIEFVVQGKEFPEERLTIDNPRHVNPARQDLQRIRRESAIQRDAYALRTPGRDDLLPLTMPVEGRFSSPFGFRRILNGEPRSRHSGLDIAANTGTPVRAPMPGTVAAVGDYFFNGKTVLLDHGSGLVTMFCHLHRVDVAEDAEVARGDVIALVGATGRATGPHLHWSVSMQGVRVDPLQALAVLNGLVADDGESSVDDASADVR